MLSKSPEHKPTTPGAEDVQAQVFQDKEGPRTPYSNSDSSPSSSSPATDHSSSPSNSSYSFLSCDSSLSVPLGHSHSHSHSHSRERYGDQQPQHYPFHGSYNNCAGSNDRSATPPTTTTHTRQFQEEFLTLLSLLPAHRYPVSPLSPPDISSATTYMTGSEQVMNEVGEEEGGFPSRRNDQSHNDDHSAAREELGYVWVGEETHQGGLSGYWWESNN